MGIMQRLWFIMQVPLFTAFAHDSTPPTPGDTPQWQEVFVDTGKDDWREQWFQDGKKQATVSNEDGKMVLHTHSGHSVLWTKPSFAGDLLIEYDFMRADSHNRGVNIIYIQATGRGQNGYDEDISLWSDKRKKAEFINYYATLNTYHISYATGKSDYLRARRYMPDRYIPDIMKLNNTAIKGEIHGTGIFADKQWIKVKIIKTHKKIETWFVHPKKTIYTVFKNKKLPGIDQGRIGLRLMKGRKSYFKNFRISQRPL